MSLIIHNNYGQVNHIENSNVTIAPNGQITHSVRSHDAQAEDVIPITESTQQPHTGIEAGIMTVHQSHLCNAADWAVVSRILEERGTWQRNAFTAHAEYINDICGENVTSSTSLSRSPIYTKVAGEYPNWTIRPSEQTRETARKLQDYLKIAEIFTNAIN